MLDPMYTSRGLLAIKWRTTTSKVVVLARRMTSLFGTHNWIQVANQPTIRARSSVDRRDEDRFDPRGLVHACLWPACSTRPMPLCWPPLDNKAPGQCVFSRAIAAVSYTVKDEDCPSINRDREVLFGARVLSPLARSKSIATRSLTERGCDRGVVEESPACKK